LERRWSARRDPERGRGLPAADGRPGRLKALVAEVESLRNDNLTASAALRVSSRILDMASSLADVQV
jgi:hypothetical protein